MTEVEVTKSVSVLIRGEAAERFLKLCEVREVDATTLLEQLLDDGGTALLTRRQRQILGLVAQGYSVREIAGSIYFSVSTVKREVATIHRELGTNDRAAAVAKALRLGIPLPADTPEIP